MSETPIAAPNPISQEPPQPTFPSVPESFVPPAPPTPPVQPPKTNKLLIIGAGVVAAVALIALGAGGFFAYMKYSTQKPVSWPSSSPTPSPVPTSSSDPTVNWKTYSNTLYGFSLKFPSKLKFNEPNINGLFVQFFDPNEKSEFANTVSISVLDGTKILTDIVGKYFTPAMDATWRDVKIGNYTGSYTKTVGQANGYAATINTGKLFFIFQLSNIDDQQHISNNDFFQMLSTFQLTDQTTDTSNWKTYQQPIAHFSIQYPTSWTAKEALDNQKPYRVTLSGLEGNVEITWGSGFGGGCDLQYHQQFSFGGENENICHFIDKDNSERWTGLGKVLSDITVDIKATANPPHENTRDVILKILSTFKFTDQTTDTSNWKTFEGQYFSFKYPQTWTKNTSVAHDPDNLETIDLKISPNAIFEASYRSYGYERGLTLLANQQSQKLIIAAREATRFEMSGNGLPNGYSIISFVVKGVNRSYLIVFNGDKKDIADNLINQILSTFKFTN